MTDEQKAALDKLFYEAVEIGEHIEWFKHYQAPEENQRVQEKYHHLRTTFPDRVAEIMKPKEGEG